MSGLTFEPWEPEESVGKLWHSFVSEIDAPKTFDTVEATFDEVRGRLGILFRGLGGARDVEIKSAAVQTSNHRLSRGRALGHINEPVTLASFDGETLRLPARINVFPERDVNLALYVWLTATAAFAVPPVQDDDVLRANIRALQTAHAVTRSVLEACPGLRRLYALLIAKMRELRPSHNLPRYEAAVEAAITHLLGGAPPIDTLAISICTAVRNGRKDLSNFAAPRGYRPYLPVPLWVEFNNLSERQKRERNEDEQTSSSLQAGEKENTLRAKRKQSDLAARKDSLILHKFEQILSWAEFLNVNRRVEDNDEDTAKKAADDLDEISLVRIPQKARTRLRLHLDLSPEEAEFERLAGVDTYPEWDHRTKTYLPDYCRVLSGDANIANEFAISKLTEASHRRIYRVKRQFEALRPRRIFLSRQIDGEDIDIEAAIEARVDLVATGVHSDCVYRANRNQERDLAVSFLLDASRSTESIVAGRQILDIAREALIALTWGLEACGDRTSIDAFSSLRRDRIFLHSCKNFDELMNAKVEARLASLRPGHYTRLGAAIRHVSKKLGQCSQQRRLLLVLTDGKPNDLDHYEGRHGIEDTHMAVREARRQGQSVFGITIDTKVQATFARIFGSHGFFVVPHPEKLISALQILYRHLVGQ